MYKRFLSGKKAVLFDLDGTIADTKPYYMKAYANVLKPYDLEWVDVYSFPAGVPTAMECHYLYEKYHDRLKGKTTATELTKSVEKEYIQLTMSSEIDVLDGFWQLAYFLKEDKKLKIGLTTNTPRYIAEKVMEKLEIATIFDVVITGDEVKNTKPHPEMYLKAAKKLDIKPEEALVFEDSIAGSQAVEAAGMSLIVIWNGHQNKFNYPRITKLFIPNFDGLHLAFQTTPEEEVKRLAESIIAEKQEAEKKGQNKPVEEE